MYTFRTETQGLYTYRVCMVLKEEKLDTVGIGMLANNKLKGMLPLSQMYIDNQCILRYNISSKVTLQQFFMGKVNKEKVLHVFRGIVNALLIAETYMLDIDLIMLKKEEIYINVSDSEPELIYFPVLQAKEPINITLFLKTILFETEFDQTENCDYVTSLINFLNKEGGCSLEALKQMLLALEKETVKKAEAIPKQEAMAGIPIPVKVTPAVTAQPAVSYVPPSAKQEKQKKEVKEKKKGFSLFQKKEKPVSKKKVVKEQYVPTMEVPGMKAAAAAAEVKTMPSKQNIQAVSKQVPVAAVQIKQESPVYQKSTMNFGETTVLHTAQAGETTVLGALEETILQPVTQPYLIRKKNGEKIYINKPLFHLGKEKNYVDYCITDNSAVSRSHADIISNENGYFIMDNNSLNHTFVNGVQIQSQIQILLEENSLLCLADEEFEFRV